MSKSVGNSDKNPTQETENLRLKLGGNKLEKSSCQNVTREAALEGKGNTTNSSEGLKKNFKKTKRQ